MIRLSHPAGVTALALLFAGCASVPKLGPEPRPVEPAALASGVTLAAAPAAAWPDRDWWAGYGDGQLVHLMDEALAGSPDVTAAVARIRSASGAAEQVGAARRVSGKIDASAGLSKQSYNNGIPAEFVPHGWQDVGSISASFGFDLDLWGRRRAELRASVGEQHAAEVDAEQARLLLTTNIAAVYADLAQLFAERDVAGRAVTIRQDALKLVSGRVEGGLDTQAELKQAAAAVPAAQGDLAAIDEQIALTRDRLAALLGAGPDRGLAIARPAVAVLRPIGVPADAGIDLVGRRPDLVSARLRAEAAAQRVKAAHAAFYPDLNLSALIGLQSLGLSNLVKQSSSYGTVGPAVTLPIFQGGRLTGNYTQARGAYDEAVANYDATLLNALREVADAVQSQQALAVRLADARAALTNSEGAYSVARQRYQGGLSTFIDVLTAEESLLGQQRAVADLQARGLVLDVALVRALGGGFVRPTTTG